MAGYHLMFRENCTERRENELSHDTKQCLIYQKLLLESFYKATISAHLLHPSSSALNTDVIIY